MVYLTYEEYRTIGGQATQTAFDKTIYRVCGIVANATHRRIDKMQSVPDEVKALCRELIDYCVSTIPQAQSITGKSQSSGGVTESESYKVKSDIEQQQDIDRLLRDYLMTVTDDDGTPLLYRGIRI